MKITDVNVKHNAATSYARGRNGRFRPELVTLFNQPNTISLEVCSRRRDGAPPIVLQMPKEMWKDVASALNEALK